MKLSKSTDCGQEQLLNCYTGEENNVAIGPFVECINVTQSRRKLTEQVPYERGVTVVEHGTLTEAPHVLQEKKIDRFQTGTH